MTPSIFNEVDDFVNDHAGIAGTLWSSLVEGDWINVFAPLPERPHPPKVKNGHAEAPKPIKRLSKDDEEEEITFYDVSGYAEEDHPITGTFGNEFAVATGGLSATSLPTIGDTHRPREALALSSTKQNHNRERTVSDGSHATRPREEKNISTSNSDGSSTELPNANSRMIRSFETLKQTILKKSNSRVENTGLPKDQIPSDRYDVAANRPIMEIVNSNGDDAEFRRERRPSGRKRSVVATKRPIRKSAYLNGVNEGNAGSSRACRPANSSPSPVVYVRPILKNAGSKGGNVGVQSSLNLPNGSLVNNANFKDSRIIVGTTHIPEKGDEGEFLITQPREARIITEQVEAGGKGIAKKSTKRSKTKTKSTNAKSQSSVSFQLKPPPRQVSSNNKNTQSATLFNSFPVHKKISSPNALNSNPQNKSKTKTNESIALFGGRPLSQINGKTTNEKPNFKTIREEWNRRASTRQHSTVALKKETPATSSRRTEKEDHDIPSIKRQPQKELWESKAFSNDDKIRTGCDYQAQSGESDAPPEEEPRDEKPETRRSSIVEEEGPIAAPLTEKQRDEKAHTVRKRPFKVWRSKAWSGHDARDDKPESQSKSIGQEEDSRVAPLMEKQRNEKMHTDRARILKVRRLKAPSGESTRDDKPKTQRDSKNEGWEGWESDATPNLDQPSRRNENPTALRNSDEEVGLSPIVSLALNPRNEEKSRTNPMFEFWESKVALSSTVQKSKDVNPQPIRESPTGFKPAEESKEAAPPIPSEPSELRDEKKSARTRRKGWRFQVWKPKNSATPTSQNEDGEIIEPRQDTQSHLEEQFAEYAQDLDRMESFNDEPRFDNFDKPARALTKTKHSILSSFRRRKGGGNGRSTREAFSQEKKPPSRYMKRRGTWIRKGQERGVRFKDPVDSTSEDSSSTGSFGDYYCDETPSSWSRNRYFLNQVETQVDQILASSASRWRRQ